MTGIQQRLNNTTSAATFSQIETQFSRQSGGRDTFIRSTDGRNLYTSDKASTAGVKAFFGFKDQLETRAAKQTAGVYEIKQALDREYGKGVGECVFKHLNDGGTDLSKGVRRSDLGAIREALGSFEVKAQMALSAHEKGASGISVGRNDSAKLASYMTDHFEVCSSPEFWKNPVVRQNVDIFGSGLAIAVLDRVVSNNGASEKDISDLRRVLNPNLGPLTADPVDVSDALQGPLDDDKLKQLAGLIYDRFVPEDSAFALNMQGQALASATRDYAAADTGAQRLDVLQTAFKAGIEGAGGNAGTHESNLSNPLKALLA